MSLAKHKKAALCISLAFIAAVQNVNAQALLDSLPSPEASGLEAFAHAVDLEGDWLAVGAREYEVTGGRRGAVLLYRRNGSSWDLGCEIEAPAGAMRFGASVALDSDRLAVSSMTSSTFPAGATFIFERTGTSWAQTGVLAPNGVSFRALYGQEIALAGDVLVVGAHKYDIGSSIEEDGMAIVYEDQGAGFVETARLLSPFPDLWFGLAVATDGVRIVASGEDEPAYGGVAHVFTRVGGTWVLEASLREPSPTFGDGFGRALAIDGDILAAGAIGDDEFGPFAGVTWGFQRTGSTWGAGQPLVPASNSFGTGAGADVQVEGGHIYSSTRYARATPNALSKGIVSRFDLETSTSTWSEAEVFDNPGTFARSLGGRPFAVDGETIASALVTSSSVGNQVYLVDAGGSVGFTVCDAPLNSMGYRTQMIARGTELVSAGSFDLELSGLPPFTFGIGLSGAAADPLGGQGGFCIAGPIGRFLPPFQASAGGTAALTVDLGAIPRPSGFVAVMAGETWTFQGWFRDAGSTTGRTNAVSLTFR